MNSNFLELVFDMGLIAAALIYGGLIFLIFKLRRAGETFLSLSLLFLLAQSLTILNLLYLALFSGIAMGQLALYWRQGLQGKQRTRFFHDKKLYQSALTRFRPPPSERDFPDKACRY